MKLTEKQKRFADYYIETGNITESAVKAGYSQNYANAQGYKLLENVGIKSYIDVRIAEKDSKQIAKQDEILTFLTKVMRGELTEQIPVGLGEGAQQLEDKDTYVKDRVKAAELIGKRYAMWTDKQQIEGIVPVSIVNDLDD
ncbi:terminase [Bacillus sp. FJAT-21945]|nr:terminase [Bacillus sp. FJAT-21945]